MRQGGFPRPAAFFYSQNDLRHIERSEIPHIPYVILSASEISHRKSSEHILFTYSVGFFTSFRMTYKKYVILSASEISHDQSEKYMPYGNPPSDIKSPF